jgi:hypothetical protein
MNYMFKKNKTHELFSYNTFIRVKSKNEKLHFIGSLK